MAEFANDLNETQIQYDLCRIPFNAGQGGKAEPIAGASRNGMSNSFPKVSPDGRWMVFVQSRNGLLMRPDSQLYIVPAEGGQARRMQCNLRSMNSWHSFSPNGRWLVFASKGRSPYTQMYLTHLDEEGHDSPAILIENSTAANRAVNIPEFVNIPPDGLLKIDIPVTEFYRLFDRAWELAEKGQYAAAIGEWRKALAISPDDAKAHNNLGFALANTGRVDEAIAHWRKAIDANPEYADVYRNLGRALLEEGVSTRRSRSFGRPSRSIRGTLRPTTTWGTPSTCEDESRRPWISGVPASPCSGPASGAQPDGVGAGDLRRGVGAGRDRGGAARGAGGGNLGRTRSGHPRYTGRRLRRGGPV